MSDDRFDGSRWIAAKYGLESVELHRLMHHHDRDAILREMDRFCEQTGSDPRSPIARAKLFELLGSRQHVRLTTPGTK